MAGISDPKPLKPKINWDLVIVMKNDQFFKLCQEGQWENEKTLKFARPDWIFARGSHPALAQYLKILFMRNQVFITIMLFPSSTYYCLCLSCLLDQQFFLWAKFFWPNIFILCKTNQNCKNLYMRTLFCLNFISYFLTFLLCLVFAGSLGILLGIS